MEFNFNEVFNHFLYNTFPHKLVELFLMGHFLEQEEGINDLLAVFDMIKTSKGFMIDLSDNNTEMGYECISLVIEFMKTKKIVVEQLFLTENDFHDNFIKFIMDGVVDTPLRALMLRKNHISRIGATSIATCLTKNMSLHLLEITLNQIGDEGF